MNIQDLGFEQELKALREAYKLKAEKVGKTLARIDAKIKVRYLCKRYGKDFNEIWKEN